MAQKRNSRGLLFIFGVTLFVLIAGGFTVLGITLPEHVDASLHAEFDDTLMPLISTGLDGFNQSLSEELEANQTDAIKRLKEAFEREQREKVVGMLKAIMPLIENFDFDGVSQLLSEARQGDASIIGVAFRSGEADPFKNEGDVARADLLTFSASEKSEFGYAEIKLFVSAEGLSSAEEAERASFARIKRYVSEAKADLVAGLKRDTPQIREALAVSVEAQIWRSAAGVCAVVLIITLLILRRLVVTPLRETKDRLMLMSQGDLNQKRVVSSRNELGAMAAAMNTMIDALNEIVARISSSVTTLAVNADAMRGWAVELASGAREQTDQITLVATAVTEMSMSISEVASRASKASESSGESSRLAQEGEGAVEETAAAMTEIASTVSRSALAIEALGRSGAEIGEMVGLIDEISEQTNLLALNATIEAARAGEQGRGFAVVANEVRDLASRTREATKSISRVISQIQAETARSIDAMREGKETVDSGVGLANNAKASMGGIVSSSERSTEMILHIASAAEEQASVTEEISVSVERIAVASERMKRSSGEIQGASEDLAALGLALKEALSWFQGA